MIFYSRFKNFLLTYYIYNIYRYLLESVTNQYVYLDIYYCQEDPDEESENGKLISLSNTFLKTRTKFVHKNVST